MEAARQVGGRLVGRYALFDELAAGGMATVHIGRLLGPAGFSRTVAIKRLHAVFAKDTEFLAMLLDEARLASRIQHPNVVATLDVVLADGEVLVVMEYVQGESLSSLARVARQTRQSIPLDVVSAIVTGALDGLQAAHDALGADGLPLEIVHRDVSPQNILVGSDGVARVADFGVAKATRRVTHTNSGQIKGKISYMAPEQLQQDDVDRRADVFAAGAVLWELLANQRLFAGNEPARVMHRVLYEEVAPPSQHNPDVSPELDAVVLRALARDREERFPSAEDLAVALERAQRPAPRRSVAEWVDSVAAPSLRHRSSLLSRIEREEATLGPGSASELAQALNLEVTAATTSLLFDSEDRGIEDTRVREVRTPPRSASIPNMVPLPAVTTGSTAGPSSTATRSRFAAVLGVAMGASAFAIVGVLVVAATRASESDDERKLPRGVFTLPSEPRAEPILPTTSAAHTADEPPEPAPKPSTVTPPRVVTSQPMAKPKVAKPACNPPYVELPDGIRRFKKECVGGGP